MSTLLMVTLVAAFSVLAFAALRRQAKPRLVPVRIPAPRRRD